MNARSLCPFIIALALLALAGLPASAQVPPDSPARIEAWVGVGTSSLLPETTYTSSYPPDPSYFGIDGQAGQTIILAGHRGRPIDFGLNYFPHTNFGFQVLSTSFRAEVGGTGSDYEVLFRYSSRQPPDYVSREHTYNYKGRWPDPTASMRRWALGMNGIGRFGSRGGITGFVSGGLALFRIEGNGESLGYTTFRLGGHSVLFPETREMRFEYGPANALGINAGGGVDVALHRNAAVSIDYRYFHAGIVSAEVTLDKKVTTEGVMFDEPIEDIREVMGAGPVSMDIGYFRLIGALKLRF
jgi:opacity protein-like surface antigen